MYSLLLIFQHPFAAFAALAFTVSIDALFATLDGRFGTGLSGFVVAALSALAINPLLAAVRDAAYYRFLCSKQQDAEAFDREVKKAFIEAQRESDNAATGEDLR